jgi:DNA-binding winged helix-turn-helix (wHTH) protein/tetratricopeptide (TPR) repeat protein
VRQFRLGHRVVDLGAASVTGGEEEQSLSPIEGKLLRYLVQRPGEVVPREELLTEVWGYRPGVVSRTIDNTVRRLRTKLEDDPSEPRFLHSIYGQGVRLVGVERVGGEGGSPFVGRERVTRELTELWRGGRRLITVCGPAGAGKTRAVTEWLAQSSLEGLWVGCGTLRDAGELEALAKPALAERGLLVLDEAEGALLVVAERVSRWLGELPSLRVLVTSRSPLDLPAEQLLPLDLLEEEPAIELFTACARLRDPRAELPREGVRRVVNALDRLPLALELAAGRVALLGLEGVEASLGAPLEVLVGRGRASMAEVLERSWELLSPEDRRALICASAFESPFEPADLAAVAGLEPGTGLQRIESLLHQSLLRIEPGLPRRYTPYAVVRDRARRELSLREEIAHAHARWFARLGEPQRLRRLMRDAQELARLRRSAPDLHAALDRTELAAPELALRCGLALIRAPIAPPEQQLVLARRLQPLARDSASQLVLGRALARVLIDLAEPRAAAEELQAVVELAAEPAERVFTWCQLGMTLSVAGASGRAAEAFDRAAPELPSAGPEARGYWLYQRAVHCEGLDDQQVTAALEQAAELARSAGDRHTEANALSYLASARYGRSLDWAGARRVYQRVVELCGQDPTLGAIRGRALSSWGLLELQRGDHEAAEGLLEQGLEHSTGENTLAGWLFLAQIWAARGQHEQALAQVESIARRQIPRPHDLTAVALLVQAGLCERAGRLAEAHSALKEALEHARGGGWGYLQAQALDRLALLEGDEGLLDQAAALEEVPMAQLLRRAARAQLAARRGDRERAQQIHRALRQEAEGLDLGPEAELWYRLRQVEAYL